MHPPAPPQSPTSLPKDQQQPPSSNLDFDNLLEKQRELLKQIRSSPDKKKDLVDIVHLGSLGNSDNNCCQPKPNTIPTIADWGYSFERIPSKSAADTAAEAELSTILASADTATETTLKTSKKSKKQRRHERQQAEEWISDWNFERITTSKVTPSDGVVAASSSPAFLQHGHDSESSTSPEWYFERVAPPSSSSTRIKSHSDDADSVMELMMDEHHDDEFATLEAAVHDVDDDISLEDLVVVDGDDDDDDDDIMNMDEEEGLLPHQLGSVTSEPQYMQELKHRQYTSAYMDELKHRQAEGLSLELYQQRQAMPPPPTYTAELKTVIKPVAAAEDMDMDEDGDACMVGPEAVHSMGTPNTSDHTPRNTVEGLSSGSSPTSVMDGPQIPFLHQGRSVNLSASSRCCVQLPCAEGMDDIFKNTLQKLTQSMKRSAESRRSLKIKTEHTQEYERNLCVYQILQSVENSSRQVDTCLQMYRPRVDGIVDGMQRHAASS